MRVPLIDNPAGTGRSTNIFDLSNHNNNSSGNNNHGRRSPQTTSPRGNNNNINNSNIKITTMMQSAKTKRCALLGIFILCVVCAIQYFWESIDLNGLEFGMRRVGSVDGGNKRGNREDEQLWQKNNGQPIMREKDAKAMKKATAAIEDENVGVLNNKMAKSSKNKAVAGGKDEVKNIAKSTVNNIDGKSLPEKEQKADVLVKEKKSEPSSKAERPSNTQPIVSKNKPEENDEKKADREAAANEEKSKKKETTEESTAKQSASSNNKEEGIAKDKSNESKHGEAESAKGSNNAETTVKQEHQLQQNGPKQTAQNEQRQESIKSIQNEKQQKDEQQQQLKEQEQKEQQQEEPVKSIILLGERHSGTNWITNHLRECFGASIQVKEAYKRFKHWFQEDDLHVVPENSAVVVVMFRDPYDWVEAMRVEPHHAHDHAYFPSGKIINYHEGWREQGGQPLSWKEFVTKPWIGRRGPHDKNISQSSQGIQTAKCNDNYSWVDAAPCSEEDSPELSGLATYKYEYQHDGSERGYSSIIDLRRDKILHQLSIANFRGTRAFFPFRFEDLNLNGTERLLKSVEEATGIRAVCNATLGKARRNRRQRYLREKGVVKHGKLPGDFIEWMNKYVDWEVESRLGYFKREDGIEAPGPSTIEKDAAVAPAPTEKEEKSSQPTITNEPVKQIVLLGERHSGTNWITNHLTECFSEDIEVKERYSLFKHWYQKDDVTIVPENSAVVVAMFRDPYDWVEAMRVEPHHAHDHIYFPSGKINYNEGWRQQGGQPLHWKEFVTKPWIGRRGPHDKNISRTQEGIQHAQCNDGYSFVDVAPCSAEDSKKVIGLGDYKYEFQHDGSERGYSSIIDLRRAKIMHQLSIANFRGARAFFPFRFEDLNLNGTARLLQSVEEATGIKAKCNATLGKAHRSRHLRDKPIVTHDKLPGDFIEWMNKYVDWEVESRLGYFKREQMPSNANEKEE